MNEIVNRTKKVGHEGFQDTGIGDSQELIDTTLEALTADRLIEVSASEPVPEDEEEDVEEIVPENTVSLTMWQKGSDYSRLFLTSFMDRSRIWALNGYGHGPFCDMGTETKADVEEGMILFGNIFREMKKLKSQTKL